MPLAACGWHYSAHTNGWKHPWLPTTSLPTLCGYKTTEGLCIFPNTGHLEVSIVRLNASFHRNSHWITSVIGFNGQMFHRWHPDWDLSNWRPNVVHPESLSSSSVTFNLCACVCFALQVFSGLLALFLGPVVEHLLSVHNSVCGNEKALLLLLFTGPVLR